MRIMHILMLISKSYLWLDLLLTKQKTSTK